MGGGAGANEMVDWRRMPVGPGAVEGEAEEVMVVEVDGKGWKGVNWML